MKKSGISTFRDSEGLETPFSKFINFMMISMFLISFAQPTKAEKRALIVAVSKYPEKSEWSSLAANNDVVIVKAGLLKQGFLEANTTVLLDEQATKAGIVNAFDKLTNRTQPGDVVFFLFAGHGQQITDTNVDEFDGWDEALVPYDAPQKNTTGEKSANRHLIDDELNELILKLRKKARETGDVLVCIDACHSGTIGRGNEKNIFRGTPPYVLPGYDRKTTNTIKRNIYVVDKIQNDNYCWCVNF